MTDVKRFGMAANHICVSTVGVVPRMKQLLKDVPGISLAVSLHAPTQEMRLKIVPTAKAWTIDKIMLAMDEYLAQGQRIMIEYILIGDVNDQAETAHILGKLLHGKNVVINLIPYNPTEVEACFKPPSTESTNHFEKILQTEYKLLATVRRTMGQDISGACGQLVVNSTKSCDSSSPKKISSKVADIEDLYSPKTNIDRSATKLNPKKYKKPKNEEKSNQITKDYKRESLNWKLLVGFLLGLSIIGYILFTKISPFAFR